MPTPENKTHFVAHVKIEKVVKTTTVITSYDRTPGDKNQEKREVVALADLTIKGANLQDLIDRIGAHTALVVDHGEA